MLKLKRLWNCVEVALTAQIQAAASNMTVLRPAAFCLVEGNIGPLEQFFTGVVVAFKTGNAQADRDRQLLGALFDHKGMDSDLIADAFGNNPGQVPYPYRA